MAALPAAWMCHMSLCVCVKLPASCKHMAHQKQLLFSHPAFKFCFYTVFGVISHKRVFFTSTKLFS